MKPWDYDITVSVWNEFWAPELCSGLQKGGFKVLALDTCKTPIPLVTNERCETSRILTALFQRTAWPPLIEAGQNVFEAFARRRVGRSKVFWGWNGHHLSAFRAARSAGQVIVCERGSTHSAWAARRLSGVHGRLGWGQTDLHMNRREIRAIEEYAIADHIMVPSRFVLRTFLEEGVDPRKLHCNPYGVDVDFWSQVDGRTRSNGPLVFIFTANITPRKGAHILLQAWEKADLRDAELWFVGGIHFPIREMFPCRDNVRFLGSKSHQEIRALYERASIYILPSFEEGMARSGLEAMAAGLPLIITEETGLTDVMNPGEHGWVVPSGDVDSLVQILRESTLDRDRLGQMSKACKLRANLFGKSAYGLRAAQTARAIFGKMTSKL